MTEWGVLSLAELFRCGLTRRSVSRRVAAGRLHWKYRGVYAVGHPKLTIEGCFLAAVKACGKGARLSHFAAAALYGFVEWDFRDIDVTITGRGTRGHPGIRLRSTMTLGGADIRVHKGVPITSPVRTVIDLAAILDYESLRSAVRRAMSLNRLTLPELIATMRRMKGRRGMRNLVKVVSTAVPTRSEFEDIVHDLIVGGGFAQPDVNMPLIIAARTVIPDFRWPEQRVIVEADSRKWHDNPVARAEDAERQAFLEAAGETVVRVTYNEAVKQPARTPERIRDAGAPLIH
jgi:uncharacterized protein DUF559